ncbi:MAG TPA: hypothetical protein VK456_15255 [Xanthobacteraceae bacterium]|nr:hypothetical protein [Xanthobacteraceae bacterium]
MKHRIDCKSTDLSGIADSLKGLVAAQVAFGGEILKVVAGGAGGALDMLRCVGISLPKHSSCCEIPEPCWMPLCGGEVECALRPGGQGQLRLTVTNEDFRSHTYTAQASGAIASLLAISPTNVTLGPKARAIIDVTFNVPSSGSSMAPAYDFVIWIVGCRSHYIRWKVDACGCDERCCREIAIEDRPDYLVHWYDHFYCAKPCFGQLTKPAPHP